MKYLQSVAFLIGLLLLGSIYIKAPGASGEVLPKSGIVLPVTWDDLGRQMTDSGVIDREKFLALYKSRPELAGEAEKLLSGESTGRVKMTEENSPVILNLLWAFGLGNKNPILESGEMTDKKYGPASTRLGEAGGSASRFASTGGWTLARGKAMDHYSKHEFVTLTEKQQALVDSVSRNIYRPCCGNSAHFPDCNHGMAMLGLLELMAARSVSEREMYRVALVVNSYWFPDTYLTIAKYMQEKKGVSWNRVDPKEMLGADYSSGAGYRRVLQEVQPVESQGGPGCGT